MACNLLNIRVIGTMVLALFAMPLLAVEPFSEKDLDPKNLARLEERATSAEDWQMISRMYKQRATMLEEKAERHEELRERYASAPKSLIAKRGQAWNTPKRQAFLAKKAREEAAIARQNAAVFLARAQTDSNDVD